MGHRWSAAGGAEVGDDGIEPIELDLGEGPVLDSIPVGHGQMGPHGPEGEVGIGGDGLGEGQGLVRVDADPVHPGVHLEVHRHRGEALLGHHPAERPDAAARVDGRDEAAGHRLGHRLRGGGSDSSRIGASMPASRRVTPSSTRATASQSAPPSRAARATGRPAVPVAVGLDHCAEEGRRHQVAEHPRVVPHGVEVDVGPRRPPTVSHAGPARRGRRAPWPQGRADRRRPSPRPGPGAGPAMDVRAEGRRAPGGRPRGPAGRRSPPRGRRRCRRWRGRSSRPGPGGTRPSGWATAVVGPFSRATAPEAEARARDGGDPVRSRVAPVRRAYSPSWGVRTTGERARKESSPPTRPRA